MRFSELRLASAAFNSLLVTANSLVATLRALFTAFDSVLVASVAAATEVTAPVVWAETCPAAGASVAAVELRACALVATEVACAAADSELACEAACDATSELAAVWLVEAAWLAGAADWGCSLAKATVDTELGAFSVVVGAVDAAAGVDCSTTTSGSAVVAIPVVAGATVSSACAPCAFEKIETPKRTEATPKLYFRNEKCWRLLNISLIVIKFLNIQITLYTSSILYHNY